LSFYTKIKESRAGKAIAPDSLLLLRIYCYGNSGNFVKSIDKLREKEYTYVYVDGVVVRAAENDITLSGELITSRVPVSLISYVYDAEKRLVQKRIRGDR